MRRTVPKWQASKPAMNESSSRPYDASLPAPMLWTLASALAKVSIVIVAGVTVLLLSGQERYLRRAIDALIPDGVVKSAADHAPSRIEAVEKKLGTDRAKVRSGAPSAQAFRIGSTRRQVRMVQGNPDRESDSTWWYGNSEVYFAGGRVVGWQVAASSPLKTR